MAAALTGARAITLVGTLCVAVGLPALLSYNLPPSPTAFNQALALGSWGLVLGASAWHAGRAGAWRLAARQTAALQAAAAILVSTALASCVLGSLPSALALSAAGMLAVGALVVAAAAAASQSTAVWAGLCAALLAAGTLSTAIGVIQVFAPGAIDGPWIARSGMAGRAVGNLRQPNHLSTLLLWSAVAVVPLWSLAGARQLARIALAALFASMLFGVVLSGSRTGLLGVVWLVAWGLLDRSLPRPVRGLLIASPLICLASAWALNAWAAAQDLGALGVATRAGQSADISSSRFAIWSNALALIARQPWLGVGFGEFNFAWTLTPFPARPTEFFDHTHNLVLHLAAELGVPLALVVIALLVGALWQAFQRCRAVTGPKGIARRACLVMVLMIGWHSQLEYPLWYAYFLLPTAFMWGLCLRPAGADDAASPPLAAGPAPPQRWLLSGGAAMVLGAAAVVWDYQRVVVIFSPPEDNEASLAERIVDGRHSWFFAHHADYALVTTIDGAGVLPGAFDRASHFLLDTRLMIAWARALAARGDVERARHVAARLREFRSAAAQEFFAPCEDPAATDKPFQCTPPQRVFAWQDFR